MKEEYSLKITADSGQLKLPFSFKIKRAAKISVVVAGIIFVSLAITPISFPYLSVLATEHHLNPATPELISIGTSAMLMICGIATFFTAPWEIEDEAWPRPVECE
jgi:hypothetical protein